MKRHSNIKDDKGFSFFLILYSTISVCQLETGSRTRCKCSHLPLPHRHVMCKCLEKKKSLNWSNSENSRFISCTAERRRVTAKHQKSIAAATAPVGEVRMGRRVRHLQPARRMATQRIVNDPLYDIRNVDGLVQQQEGSEGGLGAGRRLKLRRYEGAAARCEGINYTQSQTVPAWRQDALKVIRGARAHANMHGEMNASAHSAPETHSRLPARALRIFAFQTVKLTLNSGRNKVPRN